MLTASSMQADTQTNDTVTATVATNDTTRLPAVRVYGETVPSHLPDTEDTHIYAGKKTTVVEFGEVPQVNNNNYRQAFSELPGLLVTEMTIPSQVNLNYRGVGDPHESEYLLTLKDGIPIVSDWFGYSTVYYTPPLEAVQRVDFVRGGSSLLYGPQPGPVLNYVTYRPPLDKKFTAKSQHIGGSYDLYSTYNQVAGTVERLGYLAYYHHRQADGPRDNSDYCVDTGSMKLLLDADRDSRWIFSMDAYESQSGEAGRLSLAQYRANRDFTRTPDDRIWIERYVPSITYERDFSKDTLLEVKGWGGYQDRFSRRQSGAGANLDRQEFNFGGLDARMRHFYEAWDNSHAFTGGFVTYFSDSPRSREFGATTGSTSGADVFDLDRHTCYGALFAENQFRFGRLGVIPSFRLELIAMDVEENFNTAVTRSLIDDEYLSAVPLGGMGLTFDLDDNNQTYANFSAGYRPKEYDDLANPTSNTQQPPSDLDESIVYNYEIGVRGTPAPWFVYDTSFFYIDYDNWIETATLAGGNTERSNSGHAEFYGWEGGAKADLIGLIDSLAHTECGKRLGQFEVFGNASLLEASVVDGNNKGNDPAYAPGYVVKTGAIYRLRDRAKIAMQGQFVGDHFWQDNNAAGSVGTKEVSSYDVWDLTAEINVFRDTVTLLAGVNNIFDRDYYSRVRGDGVEPALRRNFYAGVRISWQ